MKFLSITPDNKNAAEFLPLIKKMPAFVKLYSPGCGHCVAMQKAWDALENNPALQDYDMAIIEVHADELNNIDSPAMATIGGFPTIRKVLKSGANSTVYEGDRSTKDMINFIKKEFKDTLQKPMTGGKKGKKSRKVKKSRKGKAKKSRKGRKSRKGKKSLKY
jgi:hypothetical protein